MNRRLPIRSSDSDMPAGSRLGGAPTQHLSAPSNKGLPIQDPPDLARERLPSLLVFSIIKKAPAPWALDKPGPLLTRAVLRQDARDTPVLVQPQLDFATRAVFPGGHSQSSTVDNSPGERIIIEDRVRRPGQ